MQRRVVQAVPVKGHQIAVQRFDSQATAEPLNRLMGCRKVLGVWPSSKLTVVELEFASADGCHSLCATISRSR